MTDEHDPAEFWEARYATTERAWSGKVNQVLAEVASNFTPGTALDLGCGEGGDAHWLATRGWQVLGVDLSKTAIERAEVVAHDRGLTPQQLRFEVGDLATWSTLERFDLVTSSFLQSWPVQIPREAILAKATSFVAPDGYFLVIAHASAPSWAENHDTHGHEFPSPASDLEALQLSPGSWEVHLAELREREITSESGEVGTLQDSVVLVKRTK